MLQSHQSSRLKDLRPADLDEAVVEGSADALQDRGNPDREIVGSVLKAFDVLRVFSRHKPRMTLSEVAAYAGMSRASARRFLLTFAHAGYMATDGKRFQLTPKLLELSHSVISSASLWDSARPIVAELSEKLGESCYGAVLDGTDVLYVVHIAHSARLVNVGIRVGTRLPAYCTSIGRVLLSGLVDEALEQALSSIKPTAHTVKTVTAKAKLRDIIHETRRVGWSVVDEELEVGLRSVSAPIRSRSGEIIAALNVCGPSARVTPEEMRSRFLPELLEATDRINALVRD
ncbi:MAG: helix-turn-helix domain-containing protein [Hyphomicrobiales bacterium]|jgi:IclR family pca regulon transcriptional regulator|nr:helix-turn-helix domain-containing protein [Hyphomicrobiales bacterium]